MVWWYNKFSWGGYIWHPPLHGFTVSTSEGQWLAYITWILQWQGLWYSSGFGVAAGLFGSNRFWDGNHLYIYIFFSTDHKNTMTHSPCICHVFLNNHGPTWGHECNGLGSGSQSCSGFIEYIFPYSSFVWNVGWGTPKVSCIGSWEDHVRTLVSIKIFFWTPSGYYIIHWFPSSWSTNA